jgi:hypothetical protein
MGCGLDALGSIPGRDKILVYSTWSRPSLYAVHPPFQWAQRLLPWGQGSRRESDHSPLSSVEVRIVWECIFTPLTRLHAALNLA